MAGTSAENGQRRNDFNRKPTFLNRIQRKLICGNTGTYDLIQPESTSDSSCWRLCPFRKRRGLSNDQKFYLSLSEEGLLAPCTTHGNDNTPTSINIEKVIENDSDFPVLNICHGFYDNELSTDGYCRDMALPTANFRYSPSCDPNPWIRVGLNKVLLNYRPQYEGLMVDGLPASIWMDIVEPVLQTLIMIRKITRGNRTNITKLKKPSPLHRRRLVVIGDVQNRYFMVGPHIDHYRENRFGIMALFAYRRAELGERTWRIPSRYTNNRERIIPFLREQRQSTRNKPQNRVTTSSVARELNLHRSKSDSDIPAEREKRKNGKLYQIEVPTSIHFERQRTMVFH